MTDTLLRPYRPIAFANEFIIKATPSGAEHMKLQKLAYLSYGWWLAYYDDPILSEAPQVWAHGPVFKSLYHALKHFGRNPITGLQRETPFNPVLRVPDSDTDVHQLLDWIWERYGNQSAYALSDLTHQPNSPWRRVAEQFQFRVPKETTIPKDVLQDHYKKLAVEYGFEANPATPA